MMRNIRNLALGAVVGIAVYGLMAQIAAAPQQTGSDNTKAKGNAGVSLQVATVLNEPATTLAFTVFNRSGKAIQTSPLATNYNRIVIVKPNGGVIEHSAWKRFVSPTVIDASSHRTWKLNISKVFSFWKLDAPGVYKVYWKMESYESPKVLLVK